MLEGCEYDVLRRRRFDDVLVDVLVRLHLQRRRARAQQQHTQDAHEHAQREHERLDGSKRVELLCGVVGC